MAKSRQTRPNATIPEDRQNHDYRDTVPVRTHPAPLVGQQAVERRLSEPKRNPRFRTGTSAAERYTTDAIQRAFEDVGVVFLSQDDVQLRSDVSPAR